jgi:TRAP-type mannitol/chloroaromatic compound transport system permease large subunit
MMEFIALNMAPIMFASLVVFLLLGYPVAFSLAANGLLFFFIGVELAPLSEGAINLSWPLLNTMPSRLWGLLSNETLLAIPFFTFMGIVLERSGMAEDLLDTIGQLFGPVRGGLAYAVIFVGALLAATTGVVAASVIAMGLISLPIMLRYGYDRRVASGVIAASGTLAQIIPPSLVLIVLADQLGRSVGDMYKGALVPGLVLTGLYVLYILLVSILRPAWVPALPKEARTLGAGVPSLLAAIAAAVAIAYASHVWLTPTQGQDADILGAVVGIVAIYLFTIADRALGLGLMSRLAQQVIIVLIPPLTLIFLVLGTIFLGIATPTEGGAMGAVGALVLAAIKRRLTLGVVSQALTATTRLSAFVMFILIGARVFSLTFYGVNGHVWVEHLLVSLPGGQTGFLIWVSVLVFLLAFFLDFFELAFIIVPLLAPAAESLGIDLIWFGVILGVNMQTSFMHPPFGFALFYLRSVAPRAPYAD